MSKQILVIGGGVVGLCVAYYCAERGHQVTVLDRLQKNRDGCSFGNAGMVVPSHFVPLAAPGMVALGLKWMWNPESPFYIKPRVSADLVDWAWKFMRAATRGHVERVAPVLRDLSFASRALFESLSKEMDFGLTRKGLMMLCNTSKGLDEEAHMAETANALGVPARVLSSDEAAKLEPELRMNIKGAIYFPKDCHLSPGKFMAGMQSRCEQAGVTFRWGAGVTRIQTDGRRVSEVEAAGELFRADEYVLCGGAWSPAIGKKLKLNLPMQAGKGYSLTLQRPKRQPQICAILSEARVAVTPMGEALRFGGTMEIAGLDESITSRRVQGIIKAIPHYFPEFGPDDFEGVAPWSGLRPCSPDGMPYVGRFRAYDNLSTATGHAMMGLSLGPVTGKCMSEILSGEKPSQELSLLSPDRYY